MPGINRYEGRIPVFYRKRTIEILMFGHVTALHECYNITLEQAIRNFLELYGIDEDEFPVESALVMYNRMLNNYIYVKKILPLNTIDGVNEQNKERI